MEGVLRQFPDDAHLRLLYATSLLEIEPERVAREATKAVDLSPDDPVILVRAGHLLLSRDREAARSCAARATDLVQTDFILMGGLDNLNGCLAALDGDDDLAEEKLRGAVEREPANEPFVRNLAVFLAERGRLEEGATVLSQALNHVEHKEGLERMRAQMAAEAATSE